jgi:hypothetical protein
MKIIRCPKCLELQMNCKCLTQEQINDDAAQDMAAERHSKQLETNRELFSRFGRCKDYWSLSPSDRMREDMGSQIDWINDTRSDR